MRQWSGDKQLRGVCATAFRRTYLYPHFRFRFGSIANKGDSSAFGATGLAPRTRQNRFQRLTGGVSHRLGSRRRVCGGNVAKPVMWRRPEQPPVPSSWIPGGRHISYRVAGPEGSPSAPRSPSTVGRRIGLLIPIPLGVHVAIPQDVSVMREKTGSRNRRYRIVFLPLSRCPLFVPLTRRLVSCVRQLPVLGECRDLLQVAEEFGPDSVPLPVNLLGGRP
jgi:hypothetical protein